MSTQAKPTKPTYRDIETALIAVVKAGILYKKPKDGKFMLHYKQKITMLHTKPGIREPKILKAITKLFRLYYELAKDYFLTDDQVDKKAEDFLNSWEFIEEEV